MDQTGTIRIGNENYNFPLILGSEGEQAIDVRMLRSESGAIAFDEGYGNTGSCLSDITFVDGESGILRHRGYPIEELAEHSDFLETAYLIIYGELPNKEDRKAFGLRLREKAGFHEDMRHFFNGFPKSSHPMSVLSALVNSLCCFYPYLATNNRQKDLENFDEAACTLISKIRTIAAMTYRIQRGLPIMYPNVELTYTQNFLHMLFSEPYKEYVPDESVTNALNLIFLLHADHEQNCSTSTVRMVASGGANLFASVSAGILALWGPLHGGANMAVIRMLQSIHESGDDGSQFIEDAKNGKSRLMGFGHRVYKNYDPRAKILKTACERVLSNYGGNDPLLDIAMNLESKALADSYFLERKLYPNVDFYSGIILQAIGIPMDFFTVIFAIARSVGWIANWRELASDPKGRIHRPRQIYTGPTQRSFVPMDKR